MIALRCIATLCLAGLANAAHAASPVTAMEFIGMTPPATAEEKASLYTKAQVRLTRKDGSNQTLPLRYHTLMSTTDRIGGKLVGGLWDARGTPLADLDGQMASDAPDGTSLLRVPGMRGADPSRANALAHLVQYEYKSLPPNDGKSSGEFWSKLPGAASLAIVDQDKKTGALSVTRYSDIDTSAVHGLWIPCGSSISPWNTHLGSEEYEPDAKTHAGLPKAAGSDDGTDIGSFSTYAFGSANLANPYHYGLLPEMKVDKKGAVTTVKHYAPGRYAREMVAVADDQRTSIGGDDGKNTGLFMFVADKARDLSSGVLYAAKVAQRKADNGGAFDVRWIRLGKTRDKEIQTLVDNGIRFPDIFDASATDPNDATYTKVTSYNGTEWLRLKPGMEKAAAFLETRRYAAYLGATTEFSKMEFIAYNRKDRKFYVTISRVEAGMSDDTGDIRITKNEGGVILEMSTASGQTDTQGGRIASPVAGTNLAAIPELVGGWNGGAKDAEGNRCQQDRLCGPDNLAYAESIRTLFIGEDTGRRNNNYVWAFNLDTRKLARILSTPMNAEATGLSVAPDLNGFAYITSNFQHPGDEDIKGYTGADKSEVRTFIDQKWGQRKKAAMGYLGLENGALPAIR